MKMSSESERHSQQVANKFPLDPVYICLPADLPADIIRTGTILRFWGSNHPNNGFGHYWTENEPKKN